MPLDFQAPHELWGTLFSLYLAAALILAGVVTAVFSYILVRYRDRGGSGGDGGGGKPGWTKYFFLATATTVISLTLLSNSFVEYLQYPPSDGEMLVVQVVAFRYGWEFRYNVNGTEKVSYGVAVVPTDTVVVFKVTSRDVFHSFGIPEFRVKIDAVPGIVNTVWIRTPSTPGNYTIYCYELCGPGHSLMTADLVVVEPGEFMEWLESGG